MSMIKKLFYLLPFSKAVTKKIPYELEAAFFDSAKKKQETSNEDKDLLGAQIRKAAHTLEKDMYAFQEPRMRHFTARLKLLLDKWDGKNFGKDDTIKWAHGVLKKYRDRFK